VAKVRVEYACTACGTTSPKWVGKCPGCGEWNTLVEEVTAPEPKYRGGTAADFPASRPVRLTEVQDTAAARTQCGIGEFDRVMGGGVVSASGTLIGGDPGIGKSTLLVVKRSALIALADTDHKVAHLLWTLTAQELQRVQEHMLLLIRSAQERVACFLLEMAERMAEADVIDLPMSRQDIADYLGLTIETISRTLTQLETAAAISVPTCRRIVLTNRKALKRLHA